MAHAIRIGRRGRGGVAFPAGKFPKRLRLVVVPTMLRRGAEVAVVTIEDWPALEADSCQLTGSLPK